MGLGEYTAVMGAVAVTCGALTGVAGILLAISVWWKNRGKGALVNWVHETSGAAEVARTTEKGLAGIRDELKATTERIDRRHQELEVITEGHHQENQLAISGVNGAQMRTQTELRAYTEEHMAEAMERDRAIAQLSETQVKIAATLERVAAECRTSTEKVAHELRDLKRHHSPA